MREKIPIVEKNGEILFVCGIRKSSLYSVDEKTKIDLRKSMENAAYDWIHDDE